MEPHFNLLTGRPRYEFINLFPQTLSQIPKTSNPLPQPLPQTLDSICLAEDFKKYGDLEQIRIVDDHTYGVAQIQQRALEDRYQILEFGPFRYFAIFDGHGGSLKSNHVVNHCVQFLHVAIIKELNKINIDNPNQVKSAISKAFINFDTEMFIDNKKYGTTCTMILIDNNYIYQINLGDSRSIIFNDTKIISETSDHTPESDQDRIFSGNGSIINGRINGVLMVARGFGDFDFKMMQANRFDPINGLVSVIPTIKVLPKTIASYIILTSDAPFERNAFSNKDLVQRILQQNTKLTPQQNAIELVNTIVPKTTDDTTIIFLKI